MFCLQCQFDFCDACFERIHSGKRMKEHKTSPVSTKAFIFCDTHKIEFKYFCVDCFKALCSECLVSQCKSHNIQQLTSVAANRRASLDTVTHVLDQQQQAIHSRLQQVQTFLQETTTSTEEARSLVLSECSKLTQAVEVKREQLLAHIKVQSEAKLKALAVQKVHLEMIASCATQMTSKCALLARCKGKPDTQLIAEANEVLQHTASVCAQSSSICELDILQVLAGNTPRLVFDAASTKQQASAIQLQIHSVDLGQQQPSPQQRRPQQKQQKQQQQQQQPLRADLNSFGEQLPAFNQPSEVDSTAARLEEAQQRLGRDWDAKYPHGKARELRKLRQEMAKGSEGASEQFSNVIGGAMGGRANPALAQQVLNQQGKPLSAVTDAMKSALSGDPELQQKITQAIGEGKGVEGVVGAVLSGFTEKEGGMQKLMQTVLKSLPADSGVEGMMKQALSSGGGADSMLKTAMASMGGTDGLMKVVMDKMKDSNFNDFVKGAVNVASGAGSESNDPMENFVDQAMGMLGDDVSTNLGGGDQVRKLMSKAMKKVMEGDTGDRLKQVLEGSMKTANSTSNSTKVFASTMDKVANGDMYGIVQGLLGELSDTGVMETMVKEALTAFNGNSDSMTSLIDEALKSSLGDSIPGGPDGVFGKMMKDMAKSMASNPDSLVKIVTQSLKGGTQNGVGGLDIAQMVVKGLSRKLGTPAGSNKGGDDDSGIEGIASRDLIQQYMKKMTDNAKMDPLNNIGQEFMAMMKGVMKDQNLDPEQYGALLKDTLSQDDVKHMIDDALKKNLESGSIEAMVEETLAKEFPFVPIDAVKPIITQLLQSQMQSGSLQGLLSSFVTQQVEAAALGKEAPSVADLQAKLMEEISSVLPAESKKKITNSK
eukprot:c13156_g1_i4.p1 GENE.c13156_g1_i4~~c13156_g1_i4.p1  ORF type:complete len:881 (-),score=274.94 c13156_g1_i4:696-3338(-)